MFGRLRLFRDKKDLVFKTYLLNKGLPDRKYTARNPSNSSSKGAFQWGEVAPSNPLIPIARPRELGYQLLSLQVHLCPSKFRGR